MCVADASERASRWRTALVGDYHFAAADAGKLLVAVERQTPVSRALYSLDYGKTWLLHELHSTVFVESLTRLKTSSGPDATVVFLLTLGGDQQQQFVYRLQFDKLKRMATIEPNGDNELTTSRIETSEATTSTRVDSTIAADAESAEQQRQDAGLIDQDSSNFGSNESLNRAFVLPMLIACIGAFVILAGLIVLYNCMHLAAAAAAAADTKNQSFSDSANVSGATATATATCGSCFFGNMRQKVRSDDRETLISNNNNNYNNSYNNSECSAKEDDSVNVYQPVVVN